LKYIRRIGWISLIALFTGGCVLLGGAIYKTTGPAMVSAKFTPSKVPTLILVENYVYEPDGSIESERIARYLADDLNEGKVVPLVDNARLDHVRDADPDGYKKMSIAEIGRETGAAQVIYVNLENFSIEAPLGSEKVKGTASLKVRVINANNGQTLWPLDAAQGEPLADSTDYSVRDPDVVQVGGHQDRAFLPRLAARQRSAAAELLGRKRRRDEETERRRDEVKQRTKSAEFNFVSPSLRLYVSFPSGIPFFWQIAFSASTATLNCEAPVNPLNWPCAARCGSMLRKAS